jgi:hydrogenase/urease accessory protein HupE
LDQVLGELIARVFIGCFGLMWFALHAHRLGKRLQVGRTKMVSAWFWAPAAYNVGCMIFGLLAGLYGFALPTIPH